MVGFSSQAEKWVSIRDSIYQSQQQQEEEEEEERTIAGAGSGFDQDADGLDSESDYNNGDSNNKEKKKKKKNQVLLEGYVEASDEEDDLKRTKSLTDEDLDELKGCVDLGFGFSYDEIPELCNTLPALELCYSMSLKYLDDHKSPDASPDSATAAAAADAASSPIANWKISSPGDHPEDVKARLKFWAQAVACTVRLCS